MGRIGLTLVAVLACLATAMLTLGAAPRQFPPPPLIYSGTITIQEAPAPAGLTLVACVISCESYESSESESVVTEAGGAYRVLLVGPPSSDFEGRPISFWIVNAHGRIQAEQAATFNPSRVLTRTLDLTFTEPLPEAPPTPTPTMTPTPSATTGLPIPGDPAVPQLSRLAVILGGAALAAGVGLLLVLRRRSAF